MRVGLQRTCRYVIRPRMTATKTTSGMIPTTNMRRRSRGDRCFCGKIKTFSWKNTLVQEQSFAT